MRRAWSRLRGDFARAPTSHKRSWPALVVLLPLTYSMFGLLSSALCPTSSDMDRRFYSVTTGDDTSVLVAKMGREPDRYVRGTRGIPYWDYCEDGILYWFPVAYGQVARTYRTTGLNERGIDHFCGDLPLAPRKRVKYADRNGWSLDRVSPPTSEQ